MDAGVGGVGVAQTASFARGDEAAYENSVAEFLSKQPVSNRPNELSWLLETGHRWCADKAKTGLSTSNDRVAWLRDFRQSNPEFRSESGYEEGVQDGVVAETNRLLCP